ASFDPADLTITGTGIAFTHSVDVLLTHDGTGASTLQGIDLDFTVDAGGPPMQIDPAPSNPLLFDFAAVTPAGPNRLSFANVFGNVDLGAGGTATLTTLQFDIVAGLTGTFDYSFVAAAMLRDNGVTSDDVSGELSTIDGTFTVSNASTAVPEPATMAVLSAFATTIAGIGYRRRRKNAAARAVSENCQAARC
ncbi:MAG: PEP-CTERM sorting domain-containing protein, partial [Planctomycetota bacterium]